MSHEPKKRGGGGGKHANQVNDVLPESEMQLNEYKAQLKKEAEVTLKEVFPKKIIELNALLESEKFSLSRLPDMEVKLNVPVPDPTLTRIDLAVTKKRKLDCTPDSKDLDMQGTPVYCMPNGTIPINPNLAVLIAVIKPLTIELIGYANQIKMWINFLIPKIEDGNNFGVSIQEDSMGEARQVESEAATFLDQISRYYITRAKIVSKVAKYPHIEDYRRTVTELDEKEFISLRLVVMEMRNHYASLHDLIIKNLDKIKKPRSTNNTDNMY